MAHRGTKIIVPIGAVQGVTTIGEIEHPRDIWHVVILSTDDPLHRLRRELGQNGEGTDWRFKASSAGTYVAVEHDLVAFVGPEHLLANRDHNRLLRLCCTCHWSRERDCRKEHDDEQASRCRTRESHERPPYARRFHFTAHPADRQELAASIGRKPCAWIQERPRGGSHVTGGWPHTIPHDVK